MFGRLNLIAAVLCASATSGFAFQTKEAAAAKAPSLKTGMAAPAISVEKWVKGSPVAGFEKGKTYVVEFWATWCGPCVKSMPHLTELQHQYKDQVTFVSVTTKDKNNSLEQVEKMVAQKGDLMGYTVAFDKESETKGAYRDAAGTNGIPVSFVVDKSGQVVFIGHPMYLDLVLKGVTAGTWNIEEGAKQVADLDEKFNDLFKTIQSDPKAANSQFAEFAKVAPGGAVFAGAPLFASLMKANAYDEAYPLGKSLVDTAIAHKDTYDLNMIAWTIVDPESSITKRDLDLALRAANKAAEITENNEAAILDTLARTYFCKGDTAKAIEIETKAVSLAQAERFDKTMRADIEKSLAEFKAKGSK
jgi:thiol-disulfide isomerase/thioredoxin